MVEIIDLANSIAETKENIRTAINERGISVDTNIPFSQYPQKIKEIARDPSFYARNDLGVTEIEAGTNESYYTQYLRITNYGKESDWKNYCVTDSEQIYREAFKP